MSYLNRNLLLEIKLVRKKFQIYGLFNLLSLILVILALLIGFKMCFLAIGHYEKIFPILIVILIILDLTDTSLPNEKLYEKISQTKAFFPTISLKSVKTYNKYKKMIFALVFSLYVLFPMILTSKNITYFLLAMIILLFLTLVTSTCKRYYSTFSGILKTGIKFLACALLMLWAKKLLPFSTQDILWSVNQSLLFIIFGVLLLMNILVLKEVKKNER